MTPLKKTFVHAALSGILFATCIIASVFLGSNTPVGKIIWFLSWPFAAYAALQLFVLFPVRMIRSKKARELFDLDIAENKREADEQLAKTYRESIYPLLKQNNAVAVLLCQYLEGTSPLTKNEAYAVLAGNNSLIFVSQDPDDVLLILRFSDIEDLRYELIEGDDMPIRTTATTRYLNVQEIRYHIFVDYRNPQNPSAIQTMRFVFSKIDTLRYPPDQFPSEYAYLVKHAAPRALFNEAALSKCNLFSYVETHIKKR